MIQFRCPCSCGSLLVVPDDQTGTTISCPYSGQIITVPALKLLLKGDWLGCTDLRILLGCVQQNSDRKLWLFSCACLRRLHHLLDDRTRHLLQVYECFADGLLSPNDVVREAAEHKEHALRGQVPRARSEWAVWHVANVVGQVSAREACLGAARAGQDMADWAGAWAKAAEEKAQADLFRDVFGHRFGPPSLDPTWLAWNGGTVLNMAQSVYRERSFGDLPVLADALEEAGCDEEEVLTHCRQPGEHVPGCWVLDLILGRESDAQGKHKPLLARRTPEVSQDPGRSDSGGHA